jgi:hypothetical protein
LGQHFIFLTCFFADDFGHSISCELKVCKVRKVKLYNFLPYNFINYFLLLFFNFRTLYLKRKMFIAHLTVSR